MPDLEPGERLESNRREFEVDFANSNADARKRHIETILKEQQAKGLTEADSADNIDSLYESIIQKLKLVDSRTGLWNKEGMIFRLTEAVDLSLKENIPFVLIKFDGDNFGKINKTPTLGNEAGDKVIDVIAHLLKNNLLRQGDAAFHQGGDEFAALLTGARSQTVPPAVNRLQHAITEAGISTLRGFDPNYSGSFHISSGQAEFDPERARRSQLKPEEMVFQILRETDFALARAKERQGINRQGISQTSRLDGAQLVTVIRENVPVRKK